MIFDTGKINRKIQGFYKRKFRDKGKKVIHVNN